MRAMGRCMSVCLSARGSDDDYLLARSTILDSGSTIDICTDRSRFSQYRPAGPSDFVWSGDSKVHIVGYGSVLLYLNNWPTPSDLVSQWVRRGLSRRLARHLQMPNAAYCPTFACNIASLRGLQRRGYWWDTRPQHNCIRRLDGSLVAHLMDAYDQYVLEYRPLEESHAAFMTSHQNSRTPHAHRTLL